MCQTRTLAATLLQPQNLFEAAEAQALNLFSAEISAPTHALEEGRDLGCGAIGIFAMGEVSDAWKKGEVEIAKTLAKPVGPIVRKQRIVLGPPQATRHRDRGEERGLALHHADPGGMGGAIMGKAAGEIAGLQEIVGEGLDHIVERLLAVRPMAQEVRDERAAAIA